MNNVFISDHAQEEYERIFEWYYKQDRQAAFGFEDAFAKGLYLLSTQPLIFQHCDPIHRVYLLKHFPYKVIYRVYDDRVAIVSVIHASREPDAWKER